MIAFDQGQMQRILVAQWRWFEDEMADHAWDFSPRLCEVIGADRVRAVVLQALTLGATLGTDLRGPLRQLVELTFLFGIGFINDPQYRPMSELLQSQAAPMDRSNAVHDWLLDYQDQVEGPAGLQVRQALARLQRLAAKQVGTEGAGTSINYLVDQLQWVFPEKCAMVGEPALRQLVTGARNQAQMHLGPEVAQQPRALLLFSMLAFMFGHACCSDPLYPWIAETLTDPRIVDADTRAARLEKRAIAWLGQVLTDQPVTDAA